MCRAWGFGQGFTRCPLALLAAGSARTCVSEVPDPRRELHLIELTGARAGFLCLDRWVSYVLTTNTLSSTIRRNVSAVLTLSASGLHVAAYYARSRLLNNLNRDFYWTN